MSARRRSSEDAGAGATEPRRGGAAPAPGAGGARLGPTSRRYSAAEKARLVAAYRESGQRMVDSCAAEGLSTASLCKWLRRTEAEGEAGLAPRPNPRNTGGRYRRPFAQAERAEAVAAWRRSGLTNKVFCARWGMSVSSLSNWCKKYDEGGVEGLADGASGPKGRRGSGAARVRRPAGPRQGAPEAAETAPSTPPEGAAEHHPADVIPPTPPLPSGEATTVREVIVATKRGRVFKELSSGGGGGRGGWIPVVQTGHMGDRSVRAHG